MYYLSGYDTFGYVFFQCLYLGADGTMTLLTRAPDVRVAAYTSVVEDIRMWVDACAQTRSSCAVSTCTWVIPVVCMRRRSARIALECD